jgi:hypothetical protein
VLVGSGGSGVMVGITAAWVKATSFCAGVALTTLGLLALHAFNSKDNNKSIVNPANLNLQLLFCHFRFFKIKKRILRTHIPQDIRIVSPIKELYMIARYQSL